MCFSALSSNFLISHTDIVPSVSVPVLSRQITSTRERFSSEYSSCTSVCFLVSPAMDTISATEVVSTRPEGIIPTPNMPSVSTISDHVTGSLSDNVRPFQMVGSLPVAVILTARVTVAVMIAKHRQTVSTLMIFMMELISSDLCPEVFLTLRVSSAA